MGGRGPRYFTKDFDVVLFPLKVDDTHGGRGDEREYRERDLLRPAVQHSCEFGTLLSGRTLLVPDGGCQSWLNGWDRPSVEPSSRTTGGDWRVTVGVFSGVRSSGFGQGLRTRCLCHKFRSNKTFQLDNESSSIDCVSYLQVVSLLSTYLVLQKFHLSEKTSSYKTNTLIPFVHLLNTIKVCSFVNKKKIFV